MFIYMLLVCIEVIFAEIFALPVTSDGVGDILVVGDDVTTSGVTAVDGVVPIAGSVGFTGPVWAKGTVTIIGRCGPPRQYLPAYILIPSVDSIPITTMPIDEEVNNVGYGSLSVLGEMPVRGVTEVEGVVPILGDISFGGQVRAKGTLTISSSCGY